MHPLGQSALMGAVFMTAIAVSAILRSEKTKREFLFIVLIISLAVYYTFSFLFFLQESIISLKIFLAAALVVPNTILEFFRAFIGSAERHRSRLVIFLRVSTVIVALAALPPILPPFIAGITVALFVGVMLYVSIYYLYAKSRKVESKIEATRILYLVIGGLIAVTFSFTDFLITLDIPFLPIGSLLVSVYLYLFSQAIFSFRLMDLYELFGRMAVLGALALMMAGIFSVLTLFEMASTSFFVNAVAAAFVMLIIFDPLREMVERRIGELFLKERSNFIASIEDTRREVARAFEIEGIASTLIEGLKRSGRLTNACFYVIDEKGEKYVLKGYFGQATQHELNVAAIRPIQDRMEEEGYIMAEVIRREQRILKEQEAGGHPGDEQCRKGRQAAAVAESILAMMEDLRCEAIVPVKEKDRIYGFIGVRDERFRYSLSLDDMSLLRSLAGHTAVAIENTRLYERIRERERLAAIGEMSAGLAHEIRNPLGAIKGAVQFLTTENSIGQEESSGRPGAAVNEFLEIIISEVDRLNRVVSSFLDYARPSHTRDERGVADVNSVIVQTSKIAESERSKTNVKVELDLAEGLPKVRLSEEKLGQVVWNLMINAVEAAAAIPEEGRVVVTSRMASPPSSWSPLAGNPAGAFVEVSVKDNGKGIPPAVLPKIFIPFFTTKPKGTGLGLAISHRIVREAGGFFDVETGEGRGATFKVYLPAL